MKTLIRSSLAAVLFSAALLYSCKKDNDALNGPQTPGPGTGKPVSSLIQVYTALKSQPQFYNVDAMSGGSFTTPKGTKVHIPASAWRTAAGTDINSGTVKIEFNDIYSKSDLMFSGIQTTTSNDLLVSGGEFFIRADISGEAVKLRPNKVIQIEQPAPKGADSGMRAFRAVPPVNTETGTGNTNWKPDSGGTVTPTAFGYLYSLYNFSKPEGNGTWCNCDNPYIFSGPKTPISVNAGDPSAQVFFVLSDVNTVVRIWSSGNGYFKHQAAPLGYKCTIVAFYTKNDHLYACFKPVTLTQNLIVQMDMKEISLDDFAKKVKELDKE